MNAQDVIRTLNLAPLPEEGGFFRQTFKAKGRTSDGTRAHSTAIYYLVTPESFSALHRVPQDEVFHFYAGDAVEMFRISEDGEGEIVVIGPDFAKGQQPQVAVRGGVWQGTRLREGGSWALLGCTVAPGFEWGDFELGTRDALTTQYPRLAKEIARFAR